MPRRSRPRARRCAGRWCASRLSQTYDIDRRSHRQPFKDLTGEFIVDPNAILALPRRRRLQYVRPGAPHGQRGPHGALPRRRGHGGVALQRVSRRQLGAVGEVTARILAQSSTRHVEHQLGRDGRGRSWRAGWAHMALPVLFHHGRLRLPHEQRERVPVLRRPPRHRPVRHQRRGRASASDPPDRPRRASTRRSRDELLAAAARVLARSRFILGPEVQALEAELAALCGARHGIGVNSGTDALLLALKAVGVGPGDEVITSAFSFVASATHRRDGRRRARLRRHRPGDVQPRSRARSRRP